VGYANGGPDLHELEQCLGIPAPLFWRGGDDAAEHWVHGETVESSKESKSEKGKRFSSQLPTCLPSHQLGVSCNTALPIARASPSPGIRLHAIQH